MEVSAAPEAVQCLPSPPVLYLTHPGTAILARHFPYQPTLPSHDALSSQLTSHLRIRFNAHRRLETCLSGAPKTLELSAGRSSWQWSRLRNSHRAFIYSERRDMDPATQELKYMRFSMSPVPWGRLMKTDPAEPNLYSDGINWIKSIPWVVYQSCVWEVY